MLTGCNGSVPETVEVRLISEWICPQIPGLQGRGTSEPVDMSGASISGTSVTYTFTDNGQFDATRSGYIEDPVTVIFLNDTGAPTGARGAAHTLILVTACGVTHPCHSV